MTSRFLGMAAIAWLLSAATAYADSSSLYLFIQTTVSQNSEVRAAQEEKTRLRIQSDQSQIGANPILEAGIGRKNDEFTSGWTLEAELRQPLQNSSKIASKKAVAFNEISLQERQIQKLKVKLSNSLLLNLYQIETTSQKIEVNQKRIQKLNWVKSYLSSRPFVSPQKKLELRLIESDLKDHQLDAIRLKSQLEIFKSEFQKLGTGPIPDSKNLPKIPFKFEPPQKSALPKYNIDILLIDGQMESVQLESTSLLQDANPDFEIFGRYAVESASETEQFFSIGIGTELPLSNKNRTIIKAQTPKRKTLELQRDQLIKDKESQLKSAISSITQAQDILKIYDAEWTRQMETSLDLGIDGFKKDQVDLLSVLELESQWVDALNKYHDARLEWISAYCGVNELMGSAPLGELND